MQVYPLHLNLRRFLAKFSSHNLLQGSLLVLVFASGCAYHHMLPLQLDDTPAMIPPQRAYANVLKDHVTNDGYVNFDDLRDRPAELHEYVRYIARTSSTSDPQLYGNPSSRLAYYINAYNALCMYNVLYSGALPKNKVRFFISQKFKIDDEYMSLYSFENDIIRQLGDPRIHFALNCMSRSCPRLVNTPFRAEVLDTQLNNAAVEFFNDSRHAKVDHPTQTVHYSKILKWFKKDFLAVSPSLTQYANRYRQDKIPEDYKVKFFKYDWSLIDSKKQPETLNRGP